MTHSTKTTYSKSTETKQNAVIEIVSVILREDVHTLSLGLLFLLMATANCLHLLVLDTCAIGLLVFSINHKKCIRINSFFSFNQRKLDSDELK